MKKRIYEIIQIGNRGDTPSLFADILIVITIILNILCMFLATFEEMSPFFGVIQVVEAITIALFCVEYGLRIWTAEYLYPNETPHRARLHFLRSFDGVIDLLTILPFFFLSGFVVFRMLRVVRIFHLFRINGKYDSINVITSVLYEKRNQIISSVFIILILMFGSSLCVYAAEHDVQPDTFRNAFSGIWWSMSTLLTVGYGDIYPITTLGRIMGIITAFLGVGVVAIPTGIISAGFVEQYSRLKNVDDIALRRNVQFIVLRASRDKSLVGKTVSQLGLPRGLTIPIILREGDALPTRGTTRIQEGDRLVLAGETYTDAADTVTLTQETIPQNHPWAGHLVRELDISRLTTLISIERGGAVIIPNGNTAIHPGDVVTAYTKK